MLSGPTVSGTLEADLCLQWQEFKAATSYLQLTVILEETRHTELPEDLWNEMGFKSFRPVVPIPPLPPPIILC